MTGKRKEMLIAIADRTHGIFHKVTVEALEREGLVFFAGGMRLVGCNGFSASSFVLTPEGEVVAAALPRKSAA